MVWNWQQDDWPNFIFDSAALQPLEAQFLHGLGVIIGAFRHLGNVDKDQLTIEIISDEALKTSAIEGEVLSRERVQSSLRRQFGLQADNHSAGIAHLHFVSIHPFEDGNGRIGRAISQKALAESIGQPSLIALATGIEKRKKDYYRMLAQANRATEITTWLVYFADTILGAQEYTGRRIAFSIEKTRLYDACAVHSINARRRRWHGCFVKGPKDSKGD